MPKYVTLDDTYETARENFSWDLPESFNIAHDLLRKHDDPKGSVALFQAYPDGRRETYTFHDIDVLSNRVANALSNLGVGFGDRVAVAVPQKPANPITHLACWKLGAISIPLSVLFGSESLGYRLDDSGAMVAVVDASVRPTLADVRDDCPNLDHVVEVDGDAEGDARSFDELLRDGARSFELAETTPKTPAIVMYTSGSTGPPKGALHGHHVWVGHCPTYSMVFERNVVGKTVAWTPADWAWIGALGDLLYPSWHYGRPVVGYPMGKFDAEEAFEIVEEFGVTDAFIPPTAIRMMMEVPDPTETYDLDLDAISTGGEPLTPEILAWAEEELAGVTVNELYGQTEANLLVANCHDWFEAKPGSMGKPVPGHDVAIVDPETGTELPARRSRTNSGSKSDRTGDIRGVLERIRKRPNRFASATGTSRGTSRCRTRTTTSGSNRATTTLSSPAVTGSVPAKSRRHSSNTRPSNRSASSASRTGRAAKSSPRSSNPCRTSTGASRSGRRYVPSCANNSPSTSIPVESSSSTNSLKPRPERFNAPICGSGRPRNRPVFVTIDIHSHTYCSDSYGREL